MNTELITEWDSGQEVGGANEGTENRSNRVKWQGGYLMLLRWNVWKWLKDRGSNMFVLTCGAINPSRRFSNIMKPGVSPTISAILPPLFFDLVSLSSYSVLLTWTSFTWTSSGLWLVFMSGLLFGLHPHPSAHNCTTSTSDVLIWGHWYCILGSTVMRPHLRQSDLAAPSGGIKDILFQKINHSWWTCKMFPFSVTLTPDYSVFYHLFSLCCCELRPQTHLTDWPSNSVSVFCGETRIWDCVWGRPQHLTAETQQLLAPLLVVVTLRSECLLQVINLDLWQTMWWRETRGDGGEIRR